MAETVASSLGVTSKHVSNSRYQCLVLFPYYFHGEHNYEWFSLV